MKMFVTAAALLAAATFAASAQTINADDGRTVAHPSDRSDAARPAKAARSAESRHGTRAYASTPSTSRAGAATTAFDGSWSVLILTRNGACDPAFRYGVNISNGNLINAGGAPVALEGHVAPNGAIRVSVASGDQQASGVGRLSRASGSGIWRGSGSRGVCAGTWEAERHG
jgi:hypothetical protein